ncbi:hypothetical protein FB45DRAFT_1084956 [Roridomyces roridus]|uniref:Zn(2)-C6 fungal-type domain-containing protein n=1 Tax=Roridomyces roridus TaxID=1738132 RepID=A0AAD7BNK7_9AGAR|nr:hypothetical protein FB45DRAFT_1084956 [Roridomyces roridus]
MFEDAGATELETLRCDGWLSVLGDAAEAVGLSSEDPDAGSLRMCSVDAELYGTRWKGGDKGMMPIWKESLTFNTTGIALRADLDPPDIAGSPSSPGPPPRSLTPAPLPTCPNADLPPTTTITQRWVALGMVTSDGSQYNNISVSGRCGEQMKLSHPAVISRRVTARVIGVTVRVDRIKHRIVGSGEFGPPIHDATQCETEEEAPDAPCTRCKTKNLRCEYPSHRPAEDSADWDRGQPHASGSSERIDPSIDHTLSSAASPVAPFQQPVSLHLRNRNRDAHPRQEYFQMNNRHPYRRPRPGSTLYDEQAVQARQYLDRRSRISAPAQEIPAPPYSESRTEDGLWEQFLSWSNDTGSTFSGPGGSGYSQSNSSHAGNDRNKDWEQPGYPFG